MEGGSTFALLILSGSESSLRVLHDVFELLVFLKLVFNIK